MSQIFVNMFEDADGFTSSGEECYGSCNCNCDGCYGCNCNCYSCYDCYSDCPSNCSC